jgi:hypothetical protein
MAEDRLAEIRLKLVRPAVLRTWRAMPTETKQQVLSLVEDA